MTPADALQSLYLDSVNDRSTDVPPALLVGLAADFGSIEGWRESFAHEGNRRSSLSGWMTLGFSVSEGRLLNRWHGTGTTNPSDEPVTPLLAYRSSGADGDHDHDLDHFIEHVNWSSVARLYNRVVYSASDALAVSAADLGSALIRDVRRRGAFDASNEVIDGAVWRDPTTVDSWAAELWTTRTVVYCVAGHEVSRKTALRLRALGVDAYFLRGGIAECKAKNLLITTKA
jgi:superoxide dismutase, Fe-Mn family